ncbi:hypothetical protein FACS1894181_17470 [Bacteroidia bacterium]|nr:hypothetical protein FACS1894181_17470 [Bacteroidia bacterium]
MTTKSRAVSDIDEQALLNSIAEKSFGIDFMEQTAPVEQTAITIPDEPIVQADNSKQMGNKQRKVSLDEFRQQFMQTPKIENRKPVFISLAVRDSLERLVRLFGEHGMSVSGLIENLSRNFLETYRDDVEQWRKL